METLIFLNRIRQLTACLLIPLHLTTTVSPARRPDGRPPDIWRTGFSFRVSSSEKEVSTRNSQLGTRNFLYAPQALAGRLFWSTHPIPSLPKRIRSLRQSIVRLRSPLRPAAGIVAASMFVWLSALNRTADLEQPLRFLAVIVILCALTDIFRTLTLEMLLAPDQRNPGFGSSPDLDWSRIFAASPCPLESKRQKVRELPPNPASLQGSLLNEWRKSPGAARRRIEAALMDNPAMHQRLRQLSDSASFEGRAGDDSMPPGLKKLIAGVLADHRVFDHARTIWILQAGVAQLTALYSGDRHTLKQAEAKAALHYQALLRVRNAGVSATSMDDLVKALGSKRGAHLIRDALSSRITSWPELARFAMPASAKAPRAPWRAPATTSYLDEILAHWHAFEAEFPEFPENLPLFGKVPVIPQAVQILANGQRPTQGQLRILDNFIMDQRRHLKMPPQSEKRPPQAIRALQEQG